MSGLAAIQREFCESVLDEDRAFAGSAAGMEAYRNNYRSQLLACLTDSFPVLNAWLGDEEFTGLAIGFALACPPTSWSLDHFPARFADWLVDNTEERLEVDLARIEWALAECFVAADAPVLAVGDLASTDWESARLSLAGSSRLLPLATNAAAIWQAIQEDTSPPEPMNMAETKAPHVLVWRRLDQCHLRELDADESALLSRPDFAFADLCDHACEVLGETEGVARAGTLLARWAGEGILAKPPG